MLGPEEQAALDRQRQVVARARAQGRRWYLRAVLIGLVSLYGFRQGGGIYVTLGVGMLVLAVIAVSLGRQLRLQAGEIEAKIALMEKT